MTQTAIEITNTNSEAMLKVNGLVGKMALEMQTIQDKRKDARYYLGTKVLLGGKDAEGQFVPKYEAWGADVSNTGLGLIMNQPMSAGDIKHIVLRIPDGDRLFVQVRVRDCEKMTSQFYKVGAVFIFDDKVKSSTWAK